jgi:hypothetical protein
MGESVQVVQTRCRCQSQMVACWSCGCGRRCEQSQRTQSLMTVSIACQHLHQRRPAPQLIQGQQQSW